MKKTVRTVEITWENEVSLTINRRRILSDIHDEPETESDGGVQEPAVGLSRPELVGGNDEKIDK